LRLPLKGESMRKLTSPLNLQEEVSPPWANYLSPDNFLSFAHFSFFVSYAFITWLCRLVLFSLMQGAEVDITPAEVMQICIASLTLIIQ
jgi:hypothetical protein